MFFFTGSGGRNLLGFLHYPGFQANKRGLIYCHPFAEEKNMSHPIAAKAARIFAAAGFSVFRFDLSGCGDSEGDLQSVSLEDWQHDFSAAIDVFRKETGVSKPFLWGLRLGTGLCLIQQQYAHDIEGIVLWQPVLNFFVHLQQFMRRAISSSISEEKALDARPSVDDELQRQGVTHVIGYPISKRLFNSFNSLNHQPENIVPIAPVLILTISLAEQPVFWVRKYAEALKKCGCEVLLQHVIAEPFWDRYWQWECREPAYATLQWMQDLM